MKRQWGIVVLTLSLLPLTLHARGTWRAVDGGEEDAGPGDPCYLDNGSEAEVGALVGCNGPPLGDVDAGNAGLECAHQPDFYPSFAEKCAPDAACYPASQWYRTPNDIREGECGICMKRCRRNEACPDGLTEDQTYDFCRANCPEGMRCWLGGQPELGVCVIDCQNDFQCKAGPCDLTWHICVPRDAMCDEGPSDTDSETGGTLDSDTTNPSDAGPSEDTDTDTFDGDNLSSGGCRCNGVSAGPIRYFVAPLLALFLPQA